MRQPVHIKQDTVESQWHTQHTTSSWEVFRWGLPDTEQANSSRSGSGFPRHLSMTLGFPLHQRTATCREQIPPFSTTTGRRFGIPYKPLTGCSYLATNKVQVGADRGWNRQVVGGYGRTRRFGTNSQQNFHTSLPQGNYFAACTEPGCLPLLPNSMLPGRNTRSRQERSPHLRIRASNLRSR